MDWTVIFIGMAFTVVGTLIVLYAPRFGRWWIRYSYYHDLGNFGVKDKRKGLTVEELESKFFDTWPKRGLWLLWLVGIRIMGVMFTIGGAFFILMAIFDT